MKIRLSEQFTINDLDPGAISDLTAEYLFDRERGKGTNRNVLNQAMVTNGYLYLWYRTYPTYDMEGTRIAAGNRKVTSDHYDSVLQFQGTAEAFGTKENFLALPDVDQKAIVRDFLEAAPVRVWCNCGAYLYQGHWERNAGVDSTVFPFTAPRGKGIWQAKHNPGLSLNPKVSVCKHIAAAIHFVDKDLVKIHSLLMKGLT